MVLKEKGSISVFVLVTLTFFVTVLTGVYINTSNKNTTVSAQVSKIKSEYEVDRNQIDEVYKEVSNGQIQKVTI